MSPQRFTLAHYDPERLRTLQQVFDTTLEKMRADHPDRDSSKDEELRETLAKVLVVSAEDGVSDPKALQYIAADTIESALRHQKGRGS